MKCIVWGLLSWMLGYIVLRGTSRQILSPRYDRSSQQEATVSLTCWSVSAERLAHAHFVADCRLCKKKLVDISATPRTNGVKALVMISKCNNLPPPLLLSTYHLFFLLM